MGLYIRTYIFDLPYVIDTKVMPKFGVAAAMVSSVMTVVKFHSEAGEIQ